MMFRQYSKLLWKREFYGSLFCPSSQRLLSVSVAPLRINCVCGHVKESNFSFPGAKFSSVATSTATRRYCSQGGDKAVSFQIQDEDDFKKRVIQSKIPVIVDFYADWCGPCKMLGPRLESIIDKRRGKVLLAKVNVDEQQDLAMNYDVQSLPTVVAFVNGQSVDKFIGLKDDASVQAFVRKLINE